MKKQRYIKLESVGCWFDLKTGYTYPTIMFDNQMDEPIGDAMSVHLNDCSEDWLESLEGFDETIVGIWFKANRK